MNTRMLAVLLSCAPVAATTFPVTAHASILDEWAAESFGERLADTLASAQDAARSKGQMQAEISQARRAFRAAQPNTPAYRQSGRKFAELLFGKDLYYLGLFVAEGVTSKSEQRVMALDALTGGPLDGGIVPGGRVAFARWVNGVRVSLGQPRNGQLLFVTSPERLLAAIRSNRALYEAYRTQRDREELRPVSSGSNPQSSGSGVHGATALHSTEIMDVYRGVIGWPAGRASQQTKVRFDAEARALLSVASVKVV